MLAAFTIATDVPRAQWHFIYWPLGQRDEVCLRAVAICVIDR
jgi:hypothetical protein